jgi:hypothetical protein
MARATKPDLDTLGRGKWRAVDTGGHDDNGNSRPKACPRKCKAGIIDGKYGDGECWGFVFIAGPTGSGKSTEADRLVGHARRVIKFIPPSVKFEARGWPVFDQPGKLRRFLLDHVNKPFQCIYSPGKGGGPVEEHWEYVGKMALAAGNLVLYVDEINMLCTPHALIPLRSAYWARPENQKRQSALDELLNYGRHSGVAMVMISRMPSQVNRLLTQGCDEMRIFRQTEPNVLKYFAAKSETTAAMLPGLRDYEFVLWQDGKEPVVAGGRK